MPSIVGSAFATTRSSIPYEVVQFRKVYTPEGGFEIQEICQIAWDNLDLFFKAILPDVKVGGVLSGQTLNLGVYDTTYNQTPRYQLQRTPPQEHREYSGLFVVGAELVENIGFPGINPHKGGRLQWNQQNPQAGQPVYSNYVIPDSDGINDPIALNDAEPVLDADGNQTFHPDLAAGMARVAVTYRKLPYPVNIADAVANDAESSELVRYAWVTGKPGGESLRIPANQLTPIDFDPSAPVSGGIPLTGQFFPTEMAKPFPMTHLTYTWVMVPVPPAAAALFGGMVNQAAFGLPIYSPQKQARGTMLYLDSEVSNPYFTYSGVQVVDIKYHFLHRSFRDPTRPACNEPLGHNHFYLPSAGRFFRGYWMGALGTLPATGLAHFFNPGEAGRNIHDFVVMDNLFRLDRQGN